MSQQFLSILILFSGKKPAKKLSDVEEEDEEDENHPDLEDEEGVEKENELLCNDGETTATKPKKQQKRKTGKDASNKEPSNKKNKTGEKSSEQGTGVFSYFLEIILIVPNLVDINEVDVCIDIAM